MEKVLSMRNVSLSDYFSNNDPNLATNIQECSLDLFTYVTPTMYLFLITFNPSRLRNLQMN